MKIGDYKTEYETSYKEMRETHDPRRAVRLPASFLIGGVLPPQCSKQDEKFYNMSKERLELHFYAFELYRVFRKGHLQLPDSSDGLE